MGLRRILTILPFVGAALSGCVKEDLSDCIPVVDETNVELRFTYSTEPNTPFTNLITSVDLLFFDEGSSYLQQKKVDLNALDQFNGTKLRLDPGTYYVVAWANIAERSAFCNFLPGAIRLSECFVEIEENRSDTGDPVYYAPFKEKPSPRSGGVTRSESAIYELIVRDGEYTVKTLDFVRAFRAINVWIKDYPTQPAGQSPYASVLASDLWSRYDFYFTPQTSRRNYVQQAQETRVINNVTYTLATFYSAMGKIDNLTHIDVNRASDGMLYQSVNLLQFLEENNLDNTDDIDILFTFLDLEITVTVPQWPSQPVTPGL